MRSREFLATLKLVRWMTAIFVTALSISALTSITIAQVPFETLPKVLDASMPRDQQISLALSAGPEEVRSNATVYVLGAKGYEIARQGTNGVSCLVERHFVKPDETTIEPTCYDHEGSRTLLQVDLYEAELRAKGTSEADIKKAVADGYKDGRFKAPSKPGVEYMLSSDNRLGPTADNGTFHFPPHFMFYAPYITGKDLGYPSDPPFLVEEGKPSARMVVVPDPKHYK
jgi:hypothetical protein